MCSSYLPSIYLLVSIDFMKSIKVENLITLKSELKWSNHVYFFEF